MDFLLPEHRRALEIKFVRNSEHAKRIGNELLIDTGHYQSHPDCDSLWCIIYDPGVLPSKIPTGSRRTWKVKARQQGPSGKRPSAYAVRVFARTEAGTPA